MALLECKTFSDVLGKSISFNVIYPEKANKQIGMSGSQINTNAPVLYLLHGYSDDHSIWLRRTSIERYVSDKGLVVVMPNGDLSYYTDMAKGQKYYTFISQELPEKMGKIFQVSQSRENTFIAGLSMGGYGAFKIALRNPDRYCAAASLSGVVDICHQFKVGWSEEKLNSLKLIFGEPIAIKDTENDPVYLLKNLKPTSAPKLYQCCGTEDFLYQGNLNFKKIATELGFDLTYEDGPGNHNWEYWDAMIQKVIKWLPLNCPQS